MNTGDVMEKAFEKVRDDHQNYKRTDYNLFGVDRLTENKTKHIIERDGYKITGFVLTKTNGEKCIVDQSAVRWFHEGGDFFRMMHPNT